MKTRTTGPLTVKSALLICGSGLTVGIAFQFFAWLYLPGIGLAISIATALIALAVTGIAFRKMNRLTAALMVATALIGGWIAIRSAEFVVAIDILAVIALLVLALWSLAYDTPLWQMRAREVVFAGIDTSLAALSGAATPIGTVFARRGESRFGAAAPYLRGAIVALPLLIVFGALLSSADAIFSDLISDVFPSLDISDTFADVLWALLFSWIAIGLALIAVQPRSETDSDEQVDSAWAVRRRERPRPDRYVEATVVLGAIAVLFFGFAIVQFAYLFGGNSQIEIAGVTYAEYAREGFFQLVVVTALTVAVIAAAMRIVGAIDDSRRHAVFNGLCWLLVALTLVILASALKRIGLYEDAYGLTRARFVSHGFALWLGGVLVLVAIQIQRRQQGLVLGGSVALAILALIVFNAVNPDARIAEYNLDRDRIDFGYIVELSPDAMPTVFDRVDVTALSKSDRAQLHEWVCLEFATQLEWQEWSRGYALGESAADASLSPTSETCRYWVDYL